MARHWTSSKISKWWSPSAGSRTVPTRRTRPSPFIGKTSTKSASSRSTCSSPASHLHGRIGPSRFPKFADALAHEQRSSTLSRIRFYMTNHVERIVAVEETSRDGFTKLLWAEWTKFRTSRAWVIGMVVSALVIVLLGLLCAASIHSSFEGPEGNVRPAVPLGPNSQAVTD